MGMKSKVVIDMKVESIGGMRRGARLSVVGSVRRDSGVADEYEFRFPEGTVVEVGCYYKVSGFLCSMFDFEHMMAEKCFIVAERFERLSVEPDRYQNSVEMLGVEFVAETGYRESLDGSGNMVMMFAVRTETGVVPCTTWRQHAVDFHEKVSDGDVVDIRGRLQQSRRRGSTKMAFLVVTTGETINERDSVK